MQNEQIQEFLTKVANDESFKAEVLKFKEEVEAKKLNEQDVQKFVGKVLLPKAKKLGYDFSEKDLSDFGHSQGLANLDKLSLEDLENVSGGVLQFLAAGGAAVPLVLLMMRCLGGGAVGAPREPATNRVERRQEATQTGNAQPRGLDTSHWKIVQEGTQMRKIIPVGERLRGPYDALQLEVIDRRYSVVDDLQSTIKRLSVEAERKQAEYNYLFSKWYLAQLLRAGGKTVLPDEGDALRQFDAAERDYRALLDRVGDSADTKAKGLGEQKTELANKSAEEQAAIIMEWTGDNECLRLEMDWRAAKKSYEEIRRRKDAESDKLRKIQTDISKFIDILFGWGAKEDTMIDRRNVSVGKVIDNSTDLQKALLQRFVERCDEPGVIARLQGEYKALMQEKIAYETWKSVLEDLVWGDYASKMKKWENRNINVSTAAIEGSELREQYKELVFEHSKLIRLIEELDPDKEVASQELETQMAEIKNNRSFGVTTPEQFAAIQEEVEEIQWHLEDLEEAMKNKRQKIDRASAHYRQDFERVWSKAAKWTVSYVE